MLSPLEGQSSSRLLSTRNTGIKITAPVAWHIAYALRMAPSSSELSELSPRTTNDVYLSSMLQSRNTVLSPRDLWGNVKIPMIEKLQGYSDKLGSVWIDVPSTVPPVYSSLTGVTVAGLTRGQQASFVVGFRYFILEVTDHSLERPMYTGNSCIWFGKLSRLSVNNITNQITCTMKEQNSCASQNIMISTRCDLAELYFAL
jgi:hypothetical protein